MAGYTPYKITAVETGLVQNREEFILPLDAYPILENAYVWRERILKKRGCQLLGRLQRSVTAVIGNTDGVGNFLGNVASLVPLESTASLVPGAFTASVGVNSFSEPGTPNGTLLMNGSPAPPGSFIRWSTTDIGLVTGLPATPVSVTFRYYPGLPCMGLITKELQNSAQDLMVAFDQKYAYIYDTVLGRFKEYITGTTWNAAGSPTSAVDFFWGTNYWVSANPPFTSINQKLLWVTNNTGANGAAADPIRITDGATWLDFVPPTYGQIDATTYFVNCLAFLPFRGRLVAFNTWEGGTPATANHYSNRVRWSTIGNPFIPYAPGPPATGSWRDDVRGQGGFLDLPTNEDITAVGFVRDNLVIYCERSTWQLRYTGRSIAPFQVERVNSELGAESLFSAVQFDTSLMGIGDKGIVECDSYKSQRIDIKIPDLVFTFDPDHDGVARVHGIRDFVNRLAFWTYSETSEFGIFPNRRLVYNYENQSWAIFTDSFTALGNFQPATQRRWIDTPIPWVECDFPWVSQVKSTPQIAGGNQQGFIEILDVKTTNDATLYISDVIGQTSDTTIIVSPGHNLETGDVIEIDGIPTGTPFFTLNGNVFGVDVIDADNFYIFFYSADTDNFTTPVLLGPGDYVGGGLITVRDNFSVVSKKFSFLNEGQSIQLGYLDVLMSATEALNPGAITLYVYIDYNEDETSNTKPQNLQNNGQSPSVPDLFFNSTIPTTNSSLNLKGGSKFWQRVYCPTRANFLTLQYTFSNAQMVGVEATLPVQIDAQVLWMRKGGRMTQI